MIIDTVEYNRLIDLDETVDVTLNEIANHRQRIILGLSTPFTEEALDFVEEWLRRNE